LEYSGYVVVSNPTSSLKDIILTIEEFPQRSSSFIVNLDLACGIFLIGLYFESPWIGESKFIGYFLALELMSGCLGGLTYPTPMKFSPKPIRTNSILSSRGDGNSRGTQKCKKCMKNVRHP